MVLLKSFRRGSHQEAGERVDWWRLRGLASVCWTPRECAREEFTWIRDGEGSFLKLSQAHSHNAASWCKKVSCMENRQEKTYLIQNKTLIFRNPPKDTQETTEKQKLLVEVLDNRGWSSRYTCMGQFHYSKSVFLFLSFFSWAFWLKLWSPFCPILEDSARKI